MISLKKVNNSKEKMIIYHLDILFVIFFSVFLIIVLNEDHAFVYIILILTIYSFLFITEIYDSIRGIEMSINNNELIYKKTILGRNISRVKFNIDRIKYIYNITVKYSECDCRKWKIGYSVFGYLDIKINMNLTIHHMSSKIMDIEDDKIQCSRDQCLDFFIKKLSEKSKIPIQDKEKTGIDW